MIQSSIVNMANKLARSHREADPRTKHVFLSDDPEGQEIRLVEVSESAPNSGGVMPFRFRSAPEQEIDLPSVLLPEHASPFLSQQVDRCRSQLLSALAALPGQSQRGLIKNSRARGLQLHQEWRSTIRKNFHAREVRDADAALTQWSARVDHVSLRESEVLRKLNKLQWS